MPSAPWGRWSGALDSLRAGLADLPEDWLATSPCDAAIVITRKLLARYYDNLVVIFKIHFCFSGLVFLSFASVLF